MGAVVWNANPQGGGGTTVRVLSDSIPLERDTAVEDGDPICTVVVPAMKAGDKCVVSYSGHAYATGTPTIRLRVDGVILAVHLRSDVAGTNAYLNQNFVLYVDGLDPGDHTFAVHNESATALNFMPDPANLPGTGATLVVTVVGA